MNYKEFFARFQHTAEGRSQMGVQKEENLQQKYQSSAASRYGYTFEQFKSIRSEQMRSLYSAYNELNQGSCNRLMRPSSSRDTSEEALRRVTGPNMTYNTGFIAVDSYDREIISAIANEGHNVQGYGNPVNSYEMESIVDSTEALYGITAKMTGEILPLGKVLNETDVLKTEMAKTSHAYNSKTYSDYSQYRPQPKGFMKMVRNAISKLVDPQKYAEKQNRLDEQEVPGL